MAGDRPEPLEQQSEQTDAVLAAEQANEKLRGDAQTKAGRATADQPENVSRPNPTSMGRFGTPVEHTALERPRSDFSPAGVVNGADDRAAGQKYEPATKRLSLSGDIPIPDKPASPELHRGIRFDQPPPRLGPGGPPGDAAGDPMTDRQRKAEDKRRTAEDQQQSAEQGQTGWRDAAGANDAGKRLAGNETPPTPYVPTPFGPIGVPRIVPGDPGPPPLAPGDPGAPQSVGHRAQHDSGSRVADGVKTSTPPPGEAPRPWRGITGGDATPPREVAELAKQMGSGSTEAAKVGAEWLGSQGNRTLDWVVGNRERHSSGTVSGSKADQAPAERPTGDAVRGSVSGSQRRSDEAKPGAPAIPADVVQSAGDKSAVSSRETERDGKVSYAQGKNQDMASRGTERPGDANRGAPEAPHVDRVVRPAGNETRGSVAERSAPTPDSAKQPEQRPGGDGKQGSAQEAPRTREDATGSGQPLRQRPSDRPDSSGKPQADSARHERGDTTGGGDRQTNVVAQRQKQPKASFEGDRGATQATDARAQGRSDASDKFGEAGKGPLRTEQPVSRAAEPANKGQGEAGGARSVAQAESKGGKTGGDWLPVPLPAWPGTGQGGRGAKPQAGGSDPTAQGSRGSGASDAAGSKDRPGGAGSATAAGEHGMAARKTTRGDGEAYDTGRAGAKPGQASGLGETGPAGGKAVDMGAKDSRGLTDTGPGPGRTGMDGTKVAGDGKISADATGRSGIDGGKAASGAGDVRMPGKGGTGPVAGAAADGIKTDARGPDIPILLPPGVPDIGFGGRGDSKGSGPADKGATGGKREPSTAAPGSGRGGKGGASGGAPGDRPVLPSGRGSVDSTTGASGSGSGGSRVGGNGTRVGTGSKDDRTPGTKGSRPPDVPIGLPPGVPGLGLALGGKGDAKAGTGTGPADKTGQGPAQPVDKGRQPASPADKAGGAAAPGKPGGDRAPFIPVNIPPRYGFDEIIRAQSRQPAADGSGRTSTPASAGQDARSPSGGADKGVVQDARPGDRSPAQPASTADRSVGAQSPGADRAAATTARLGDKGAGPGARPGGGLPQPAGRVSGPQHPAGDRQHQSLSGGGDGRPLVNPDFKSKTQTRERTSDARGVQSWDGLFPRRHGLPELELTGKADSGPWEWPKHLERQRSLERDFQSKPISNAARAKDALSKPDAQSREGTRSAKGSTEKPIEEKLLEFVRNNREALEEALRAQGSSNPALQELVRIVQGLDAAGASEEATKQSDLDNEAAGGTAEFVLAADASVISRNLRHRERSRATGQDQDRHVYIIKEEDSLESIADELYREKKIGALIHELNKDIIPSTYLCDRIVVELIPGRALYLPTYDEIQEFLERVLGSTDPVFEYSRGLAAAEEELAE